MALKTSIFTHKATGLLSGRIHMSITNQEVHEKHHSKDNGVTTALKHPTQNQCTVPTDLPAG